MDVLCGGKKSEQEPSFPFHARSDHRTIALVGSLRLGFEASDGSRTVSIAKEEREEGRIQSARVLTGFSDGEAK